MLEMKNIPRLKHEETENVNRLITNIEIEIEIIKLPLFATSLSIRLCNLWAHRLLPSFGNYKFLCIYHF